MEIELQRVKPEQRQLLFRLLQYSLFEESLNDFNEMERSDGAGFLYRSF